MSGLTRRTIVKGAGVAGAAGLGLKAGTDLVVPATRAAPASAQLALPATKIVKSVCHQCPARCGIDVYVTNGKVHAIYGSLEHPASNGKLCPKGHLGAYILYDPDRFKGPMKRTNPKKGRNEDPKFVAITWDEALDTIAGRLNGLRDKGEQHRFAILHGRGWGASDAGLLGDFGKLYGTPNAALGHSSMCSDASKKAKQALDGNYSYNAYDYRECNYLLNFGAAFLEAYRPYNNNMQTWGYIRTKSPKTKVAVVDIRVTTTGAAADHLLLVKPGTDGALALAIAHVLLTEGLWDRRFVGRFIDGVNHFKSGEPIDPALFREHWTKGLIEWWNAEVKDRTPAWASKITTIAEKDILKVAREFGTTRPAMAIFERGPTTHTNATYNGLAIHTLNALVGAMYAKGGMMNQMGVPYGSLPIKADEYVDDVAKAASAKKLPRIDKVKTKEWPLASNMIQEIAKNQIEGNPYKLDTVMFYLTNPIFSTPDCRSWEKALPELFVIETSPFPSETSVFADIIVPDHTYLERLQDTPTYPAQGYPVTSLRVPAVKPLYDTKAFSDTLIEIGKRVKGPMGDYYKKLENTETVIKYLAKGFEKNPGDNGVKDFASWVEKGVWYKKPYLYRQIEGEFYEWDGTDYRKPMSAEEVKKKLLKTESGKFEIKSSYLEKYADYIAEKVGIAKDRVGFPQWVAPKYTGNGDLHFVTPKTSLHAEGRSANIPHAISIYQPVAGGRNETFLEIHPQTAKVRGIRDGDLVRISSDVGSISARVRLYPAARPDTVVLPFGFGHFAHGRWAKGRGSNVSEIIPNVSDPISGLTSNYTVMVKVEKLRTA
ncbi:MAG: molybdopterin-dependent oxidoreductase [Hyphomicrobiaceae bacterium]|nr:MAG: molybdopterin-dependent oxidoreductase [Hyphomicrobiaceae bacterium]